MFNRAQIYLAISAGIASFSANAVVTIGPGESATITSRDKADHWNLRDGASLTMLPGAFAESISAINNSTIYARSATIKKV